MDLMRGRTVPETESNVSLEVAFGDMTTRERLREVRNAQHAILVSGQSYQIGTRKLTRADLGELRRWEAELEARLAAEELVPGAMANTGVARFI